MEGLALRRSARQRGLPAPLPTRWQHARCSPADERAPCGNAALPEEALFRVFAALTADARARCGCVCRAWAHAVLCGGDAWRCWTRLDLSGPHPHYAFERWALDPVGAPSPRCVYSDAWLVGAAALARGRLQELDLSERNTRDENRDDITLDALLRVLRSSGELRTLALSGVDGKGSLYPDVLQQILAAAPPTLHRLDVERVFCDSSAASMPLLFAEPPRGPLFVRVLSVYCDQDPPHEGIGTVVGARRFGAAVAHAKVRELSLSRIWWAEPEALEALADALLAPTCGVEKLDLSCSDGTSPAYLPALARLLAGRDGAALADVSIDCTSLFVDASAADVELVCTALRRTTLTHVVLHDMALAVPELDLAEGLTPERRAALRQAARAAPRLRLEMFPVSYDPQTGEIVY